MIKETYVVIRNHENNGETYVFSGEILHDNLVEIGHLISKYQADKDLPNWINQMLTEKERAGRKPSKPRRKHKNVDRPLSAVDFIPGSAATERSRSSGSK